MSAGELLNQEDEDSGLQALPRLYQPLMWVLCMALVFFQIYTAGFGQLPPLSQRAVHVGLGLAISSGIVNDLGGRLSARNGQNGGAVFEMQLPILVDGVEAAE